MLFSLSGAGLFIVRGGVVPGVRGGRGASVPPAGVAAPGARRGAAGGAPALAPALPRGLVRLQRVPPAGPQGLPAAAAFRHHQGGLQVRGAPFPLPRPRGVLVSLMQFIVRCWGGLHGCLDWREK